MIVAEWATLHMHLLPPQLRYTGIHPSGAGASVSQAKRCENKPCSEVPTVEQEPGLSSSWDTSRCQYWINHWYTIRTYQDFYSIKLLRHCITYICASMKLLTNFRCNHRCYSLHAYILTSADKWRVCLNNQAPDYIHASYANVRKYFQCLGSLCTMNYFFRFRAISNSKALL